MPPTMDEYLQRLLLLLPALLLILLTGFFVAAEFSLVKIRPTRIDELAARNVFGARKVQQALRNLSSYISAAKFGVMVCTLILGKISEPALEHIIGPLIGSLPRVARGWAESLLPLIIVSIFEFILGELAPTSLAIRSAEKIVLTTIYPLDAFYRFCKLPIAMMTWLTGWVLRPFGIRPGHEHGGEGETHSEDELRLILEASHAGGAIRESELTLATRVFDFAHSQAKDIMIPRPDIVFLSTDRTDEENRAIAEKAGFTRFPLVENGSPDDILGMVHIKDLYSRPVAELRALAREMPRIPETKPIDQLLKELQRNRQHMVVVMDEYGGTSGIITIEDIIEEIVGDIQDEFDPTTPEMESAGAAYLVDARMSLDKLRRQLEFSGPEQEPEVDTVGGWVLAQIPGSLRVGTAVPFGEATFTVAEVAGRRVRKVRVSLPRRAEPEPA